MVDKGIRYSVGNRKGFSLFKTKKQALNFKARSKKRNLTVQRVLT